MDYFWSTLLSLIALAWIIQGVRGLRGMWKIPYLSRLDLLAESQCPTVSILVAARDEARKLPRALPTWLAQDYPHYEVIVADDRSQDATTEILAEAARVHTNLKLVRIAELPRNWLGKPHGYATAYLQSSGDWLVFTDADVRFAPDLLRRSVALVQHKGWDHLTLIGLIDMSGFWEKAVLTYFGLGFLLNAEPWQVSNPRSRRYMGVGSFQLLRRSTYEAIGTHRRLAMEVVDDMKLGKLVKQGGFRSGVAIAEERLRVRWQEGLGNVIRGTTKNFFAAQDYSVVRILISIVGLLLLSVVPYAALGFCVGLPRLLGLIAVVLTIGLHGVCAWASRVSWLYGLTHPVGAVLFAYMLWRSMVVTLGRGGVVWRDTFYPLDELKRGLV